MSPAKSILSEQTDEKSLSQTAKVSSPSRSPTKELTSIANKFYAKGGQSDMVGVESYHFKKPLDFKATEFEDFKKVQNGASYILYSADDATDVRKAYFCTTAWD